MNSAIQDAIETLRQLQKLSKELQPVKTALATLIKREQANPNPLAAAESLEKVAARVVDVSRKYGPFFDRASFLLERELPRLQRVTPLLGIKEEEKKSSVSNDHKKKDVVTHDAFRYVCLPTVPHILKAENYNIVRRMVCLRMEMVDYLIVTERYQLALHVLDAYGLPLFWFPKLLPFALPVLPPIQSTNNNNTVHSDTFNNALENYGMKLESHPTSTFGTLYLQSSYLGERQTTHSVVAPEHIAIQCIEAKHSVVEAITYCEERLLPAMEQIDSLRRTKISDKADDLLADLHATRLLQIYLDGKTDQESVIRYISAHFLRYAARRPEFVQTIIDVVTLQNDPYTTSASSTDISASSGGEHRFKNSKTKSSATKKREESMRLVACMMSMEGYHKLAVSFHQVAILVGSQILSGSKAFGQRQERQRGDEGNMNQTPHILPDLVTRVVVTSILLKDEYFDRMVLQRRADVSTDLLSIVENHLNTQSGSVTFDLSMMSVVEEMLGRLCSIASRNRNTNTTPFTSSELLEAEECWNNDILFIKRPTRFYCYLTKKCFDGGTDANCPMALPNGTVVSKLALFQSCIKKTGEGEHSQNCVVCPRTRKVFSFSSLRRIFVT